MKNSATMNRRNFNNSRNLANRIKNYKVTRQNVFISAMIVAYNFGMQAFSFLRNLVTVGGNPYAGLHRGHLRRMYWLPYVIGY